ncbi:hypothetical protein Slala05_00230 [Streptomyces lavendulae subsp. lavendulae]|nr:hypothetical protein Slala05_00230 [Streptomyces lavendulae subsp. lavendulae]
MVANRSGAWGLDALVLQKVFARDIGLTLAYARGHEAAAPDATPGLEHLNARELVGVFPEGIYGPGNALPQALPAAPLRPKTSPRRCPSAPSTAATPSRPTHDDFTPAPHDRPGRS